MTEPSPGRTVTFRLVSCVYVSNCTGASRKQCFFSCCTGSLMFPRVKRAQATLATLASRCVELLKIEPEHYFKLIRASFSWSSTADAQVSLKIMGVLSRLAKSYASSVTGLVDALEKSGWKWEHAPKRCQIWGFQNQCNSLSEIDWQWQFATVVIWSFWDMPLSSHYE